MVKTLENQTKPLVFEGVFRFQGTFPLGLRQGFAVSHFLRSQKICTALAVDSARGGERQHAAGNPDAACDIGARVKSSRRRVQFGRGRCEWYPLGLQRNFAGPTQNGSTFGHSFSTSSKHNQTTKPFSACERSRPLTHTGSLHVPIIALPAHQTNEPH